MEDLLKLILGGLGTLFMAAIGLGVAYFKYVQRKFEQLETEKKEYKDKKEQKEVEIKHLYNGFREEVKQEIHKQQADIKELKQDVKLIKQFITGDVN